MADNKTNVMRMLDRAKVAYTPHEYPHGETPVDGVTAAELIGKRPDEVCKTLVAKGASGAYCIFVIPVAQELDLKRAAKAAGEKSVAMIPVKDITAVTGYVRGGCSPLGMKKQFMTVIHSAVSGLETVTVSAGRIGAQVEMKPGELIRLTRALTADICIISE